MSGPEPAAHMPHIHTSCRSERYVVNFSTVCIQQKSLNYTTNIEYARSGQYSNVVEFEFALCHISRYNAECGKSATGILRNGDAELTLKLTLTLTLILTLFSIIILQNTCHRYSAFRILPLPVCV